MSCAFTPCMLTQSVACVDVDIRGLASPQHRAVGYSGSGCCHGCGLLPCRQSLNGKLRLLGMLSSSRLPLQIATISLQDKVRQDSGRRDVASVRASPTNALNLHLRARWGPKQWNSSTAVQPFARKQGRATFCSARGLLHPSLAYHGSLMLRGERGSGRTNLHQRRGRGGGGGAPQAAYKGQLEGMLAAHVVPLFASPHGHLRAKACWLGGVFSDTKFAAGFGSGPTFQALFRANINCLADPDMPVRPPSFPARLSTPRTPARPHARGQG